MQFDTLLNSLFIPEYERFASITQQLLLLLDETEKKNQELENQLLNNESSFRNFRVLCQARLNVKKYSLSMGNRHEYLLPGAGILDQPFNVKTSAPKLEKIVIPTLNSDILDFPNYKSLMLNLVHENTDLNNVQMYYFKQSLAGPSAELSQDFELSNESYLEVWLFVLAWYDNKS